MCSRCDSAYSAIQIIVRKQHATDRLGAVITGFRTALLRAECKRPGEKPDPSPPSQPSHHEPGRSPGTVEVKLLNKGSDGGMMMFEPAYVRSAVGNT
jgi:hypothetical protein